VVSFFPLSLPSGTFEDLGVPFYRSRLPRPQDFPTYIFRIPSLDIFPGGRFLSLLPASRGQGNLAASELDRVLSFQLSRQDDMGCWTHHLFPLFFNLFLLRPFSKIFLTQIPERNRCVNAKRCQRTISDRPEPPSLFDFK